MLFIPKGYLPLSLAIVRLMATLSPPTGSPENLLTPPWNARDAARAKLRQPLGDGELIAVLQSRSTGSQLPIKTEWWRTDDGYAALRSGGRLDDGDVFLRGDDFARWLAGNVPPVAVESGAPTLPAEATLQQADTPDAEQDDTTANADEPSRGEDAPMLGQVGGQTNPASPASAAEDTAPASTAPTIARPRKRARAARKASKKTLPQIVNDKLLELHNPDKGMDIRSHHRGELLKLLTAAKVDVGESTFKRGLRLAEQRLSRRKHQGSKLC